MRFPRTFTRAGIDPFDSIMMEPRRCRISNMDGSAAFEIDGVLFPLAWSHNASNVVAQKYFRKAGVPSESKRVKEEGIPVWCQRSVPTPSATFGAETDVRQVIRRLAGTWTYWGFKTGMFTTEEEGRAFHDEICHTLIHQMWAPNSPQWFNTGLHWAYGIEGPPQGHHYVDPVSNEVVRSTSAYQRPQPAACFIQSVDDDLVGDGGIMDLWVREARLFKYGSGTGTNFSSLRGAGESLSGGGMSSGVMSWLRIGDRAAQGIQSGGTTRRAAKMVLLDVDHPEICEFVNWKVTEEQKVSALVVGSHVSERVLNAVLAACHSMEGEQRFDPKVNVELGDAILDARDASVPDSMVYRAIELAKEGVTKMDLPLFDTDWQGAAYDTVSGQQSNNSVAISHAFLEAVENNESWNLTRRTDGSVCKTISAVDLWNDLTYAAWACADPGVQFNSTMNEWHTCSADAPIRGTNPCSEYVFIDDTACNLASMNLVTFENDSALGFDLERFVSVTHLVTTVLEISVAMSQLPSAPIARKTFDYRTLGLGYANLGALLMRRGLPYDSPEARGFAAALTAIMTGEAYVQSAYMAERLGAFPRFEANREPMMRVIGNHAMAALGEDQYEGLSIFPRGLVDGWAGCDDMISMARDAWRKALSLGEKYGYRNAQVSVLAPTGTISIEMDCDTTGIEPDFTLVKYKSLAGGGGMTIINQSVPVALERLGYDEDEVQSIVDYVSGHRSLSSDIKGFLTMKGFTSSMVERVEEALRMGTPHIALAISEMQVGRLDLLEFTDLTDEDLDSGIDLLTLMGLSEDKIFESNIYSVGAMTIEGAPGLADKHLAVFDCANRCGLMGERFISAEGHIQMMGAVQPFLSGAISKTVNMPREATLEDVRNVYRLAWKAGVKAIALYRDGSKLSQPLGSRLASELFGGLQRSKPEETSREIIHQVSERMVVRYLSERRKLPFKRRGYTQKAIIGGHKVFLRTGEYQDGTLGEMFIDTHKEGAAFRSLLAAFAMAVSVGLQHGVPLEKLVELYTFTKYEPNGIVMGDAQVRTCTSLLDWVFRHLAVSYLGREDLASVKKEDLDPDVFGETEPTYSREKDIGSIPMLRTEPIDVNEPYMPNEDTSEMAMYHTWMATGGAFARSEDVRVQLSGVMSMTSGEIAKAQGYEGDPCNSCGQLKLVRTNGGCTKCMNCGDYGGCS